MTRVILDILPRSLELLTSRDIALQLLEERDLNAADEKLMRLMVKRVDT